MWIEAIKAKVANTPLNSTNIANRDPIATTSEDLSKSLDSSINETTNESKMTSMEDQLKALIEQVNELKLQVREQRHPTVTEYTDFVINVNNSTDISLDIFKTLPEFSGNREKYATWRSTASTAIKMLEQHKTSLRYGEAIMIIRNKVTGPASNILNNYNTAFNFDAIIDRLDFTYADKRPLYILEQELSVLQQNKLTVDQFYDKINEKLNCIVNKINMSYKEASTASAFIENVNIKALRTFITGLSNKKGELLYASNPKSLPEAYARLQTIMTDQERINFANRYTYKEREKEAHHTKNPQFRYIEPRRFDTQRNQPDQYESIKNPQFRYNEPRHFATQQNQPEPMEIDKSSTHVNIGHDSSKNHQFNTTYKRSHQLSNQNRGFQSSSNQKKFQRVNNMAEENSYAKTIIEDESIDDTSDNEANDTASNCSHTSKRSSIFLGE